jgi:hypothetical protein
LEPLKSGKFKINNMDDRRLNQKNTFPAPDGSRQWHLSMDLMKLAWLLALIKFILPFFLQDSAYEPHRDEFLYLSEARHLDWGYLELPPMMSILGWFSNLMGGSLFWIRIWPSLFGSLTYMLIARLILSLQGGAFALLLGFLPFVFGYFLHVFFIFQPNFLEVFFWTLMGFGLLRYVQTKRPGGLYIAGLGLGLGMLSKYSVSFFAISLLTGLIITKQKDVLKNRHFYYAMLMALLLFLPNLVWQFVHGFPEFNHLKELQQQQLKNVSRAAFLADQLLLNLPCIFIWASGVYWVAFTVKGKPFRFIGWAFAIVITLLVAGSGKSYYGMPAYPVFFGFGAVLLENWTGQRLRYMRYAMLGFVVFFGCLLDMIALPMLPPRQLANYYARNSFYRSLGFLKWEDQKDHLLPQDFADMLSWKEMTEKMSKIYEGLDSTEKSQSILDCDNYGEAGAVDYYGPPFHLPAVMAHGANYLFWVPKNFYQSNVVILVSDYDYGRDTGFIRSFRFGEKVDSISNPYARESGSYFFLFKGPTKAFQQFWKTYYEDLRKKTSVFD